MKVIKYEAALAIFRKYVKTNWRTQQEATVAFGYKSNSSVISNTLHGHRPMTTQMLAAIGMEYARVVVKK